MIRRPVIIQKDMDKEDHPIALLVQEAASMTVRSTLRSRIRRSMRKASLE